LLLIEAETSGRMASLQTCPVHPNTDGSKPERSATCGVETGAT